MQLSVEIIQSEPKIESVMIW